jgi:hypothetical protein
MFRRAERVLEGEAGPRCTTELFHCYAGKSGAYGLQPVVSQFGKAKSDPVALGFCTGRQEQYSIHSAIWHEKIVTFTGSLVAVHRVW